LAKRDFQVLLQLGKKEGRREGGKEGRKERGREEGRKKRKGELYEMNMLICLTVLVISLYIKTACYNLKKAN
jgi:hypothetical protein